MLFGNFQQACHYLWRSFRIFVAVEVLARAWKQAVNVNSCLMWFFFSICGRQQILRCIIINHSCYHKQIACNRQLEPIQFQADSVLLPFYFILLDLPKSLWKWWLNVMITHHVAVFQGTIETVSSLHMITVIVFPSVTAALRKQAGCTKVLYFGTYCMVVGKHMPYIRVLTEHIIMVMYPTMWGQKSKVFTNVCLYSLKLRVMLSISEYLLYTECVSHRSAHCGSKPWG